MAASWRRFIRSPGESRSNLSLAVAGVKQQIPCLDDTIRTAIATLCGESTKRKESTSRPEIWLLYRFRDNDELPVPDSRAVDELCQLLGVPNVEREL